MKFVVFGSQIDLQAHMMEEHGAEMSSRDKKDARRVNAAFEFQDTSSHLNRRRGGVPESIGGGGSGSGGGRQRESQPQIAPRPTLGLDSRQSSFGVHLATERDVNDRSPEPSRQQALTPPPSSMDPLTAEYISFNPHTCPLDANLFLLKTFHGDIRAPPYSHSAPHQRRRGRQACPTRLHGVPIRCARPHLYRLEHA